MNNIFTGALYIKNYMQLEMDRPLHDIELRIKTAEDNIETLQYDKDLLLGKVDSLAEIIQQLLRTPHKLHHENESVDSPPRTMHYPMRRNLYAREAFIF